MSAMDLATTIHNIPPAAVAQKLRGRCQWAAYQALAAVAGEWMTADALAMAVYPDEHYLWDPLSALKGVIVRLRAKGIPIHSMYTVGSDTKYRLPLEWQQRQDDLSATGGAA